MIVRIVPNHGVVSGFCGEIQRPAVQEFFESPVRVDVELRDRLELPRSGKLQSMICEVPADGQS